MSVANGLSYHRNDPYLKTKPPEIKEWHMSAVRMALKSRAGWKNRVSITTHDWGEDDLEAIRLYGESLGWETREDSDDDGATVIFEKGKQCKLLLLPCKPCKAC